MASRPCRSRCLWSHQEESESQGHWSRLPNPRFLSRYHRIARATSLVPTTPSLRVIRVADDCLLWKAPIQQPYWWSPRKLPPHQRISVFRQRAIIWSAPTLVISSASFPLSDKPRFVCRSWTRGSSDCVPFWCSTSEPHATHDTTQVIVLVSSVPSVQVNADGSMTVRSFLDIRRQRYAG